MHFNRNKRKEIFTGLEDMPLEGEPDELLNKFHPYDAKYIFLDGIIESPIVEKLKDSYFETEKVKVEVELVKKHINIMSLNIPKFQFEKSLFSPLKILTVNFPEIDLFCLSELYVKTDFDTPSGYKLYTHSNGNIKTTAILVKSEYSARIEQLDGFLNFTAIKFKTGPKNSDSVKIISCYRSPSTNTENTKKTKFFEDLGYTCSNQKLRFDLDFIKFIKEQDTDDQTIICGDINWATSKKFSKNRVNEKLFQQEFRETGLINSLRNKITYYPDKANVKDGTSIDAIIHTKAVDIKNIEEHMVDVSFISDHFGHSFLIPYKFFREKRKIIKIRKKLKNKETLVMKNIIENLDHEFDKMNIYRQFLTKTHEQNGQLCKIILDKFSEIFKKCNEIVTIHIKSGQKNCKMSLKYDQLKKRLKRMYLELKNQGKLVRMDDNFKKLQKELELERRKCIRNNWKSKLSNSAIKNKLNWAMLEKFKNQQTEIPDSLTANDFAKRFHELSYDYTPIKNEGFDKKEISKTEKFAFKTPVTFGGGDPLTDIKLILQHANNSESSSSWDEINLQFLKLLPKRFMKIICYVLTAVLKTGCYLSNFRDIKSFPVYKKGKKTCVKNYRPINVAPTFANLIEKIMCTQMSSFWNEKGLLHKYQFGFRKGHNVGQLINTVRNHIFRTNKKYHCLILTDLSNAFGSCDVHLILKRMSQFCSVKALKLLRSFLIQPKIKCIKGEEISKPYHFANRGYSQGSNLSPFLFTCLMRLSHDLPENVHSFSYADDDQLVVSSDNIDELRNLAIKAIESFHTFCKVHNIKLNTDKTFFTLSGKFTQAEKQSFFVSSFGAKIEQKDSMNMLGVSMDQNLNFFNHFDEIRNRTVSYCNLIYNFGKYTTRKMIKNSIYSFIGGKFNHGISYIPETNSKIYQSIQSQVNLLIHKKLTTKAERDRVEYGTLSQEILLKRAQFLSFQNLHRLNQMQRLNKIVSTCEPIWEFKEVINSFCKNGHFSPKFLESRTGIKMYINNKDSKTTAPNIWVPEFNSLPSELRNRIGTKSFTTHIKHYYKNRCQHSEIREKMCQSCGQNTFNYKNKSLRHGTIDFITGNNTHFTNFEKLLQKLSNKKYKIDELTKILETSDIFPKIW